MTDLETMKYAKMWLEKLANGINPLTDEPIPESECVNQVRISRCLFYSANIIGKVIDNNGMVGYQKKTRKEPFSISKEQLSKYVYDETPILVGAIAEKINMLTDLINHSKLRSASINTFLLNKGLLEERMSSNDRKYKVPTNQGYHLGISREERTGEKGTFFVNLFNKSAQKFIIDHIDEIIEINNVYRDQKDDRGELQGAAWSRDHEEILVDLFKKNVPVSEIAITLKRSETGIRAKLKKLGLIEHRSDAT